MTIPVLIELRPESRPAFSIIFRGLGSAIYEKADNELVRPDSCDEDGTLFLRGMPEDYVGDQIALDSSNSVAASFTVLEEMVEIMRNADECSFGIVGVDGRGPGFVYDGNRFDHDKELGVQEANTVCEDGSIRSETRTLSKRPFDKHAWVYFDEELESSNEIITDVDDQVTLSKPEAMEIECDVTATSEQCPSKKTSGEGDQASDPADEVHKRMRKLRLQE